MNTTNPMFHNNLYMVSPDNGSFPVTACRAESALTGDIFNAYNISASDREFAVEQINGYVRQPLLIRTGDCPMLIVPSLYPSTGMILLITSDVPLRAAVSLAQNGSLGHIMMSPSLDNAEVSTRISEEERDMIMGITAFLHLINRNTGITRQGVCYRIAAQAAECSRIIAEFVGCRLDISENYPYGSICGFDGALLTAFVICAVMFIRRVAAERNGTLEFFKIAEYLAVAVETECPKNVSAYELETIKRYALAANIY